MSFSPPWRSACALPNAPSPALRVKTPRPDEALSAGLGALWSRSSWRAEAGGRLARPPPRSAGRWTEGHPDPFQKQVPTRVLPTPAFGTARQLRARLPRCLSRPSHPVFSHRNRLCVTTTQKTEGSSAESGGPWGRLPSRSRAAPLQQALSAEQLPFPRLVAQAFADAPSARDDRHSQEILANGRPAGSGPWSSPCSAGKREPSGLLEQGAASGAQPGGGLAGLVQLVPWLSQNA